METQQFPNHVISFRKRDLLNIKTIRSQSISNNIAEVNFKFSSNHLSKVENLG